LQCLSLRGLLKNETNQSLVLLNRANDIFNPRSKPV
jgi:hypothetical protein